MTKQCFFCDVQSQNDQSIIGKNSDFFAKLSDFPVSKGHVEIATKLHIGSFFELTDKQAQGLFSLICKIKKILDKKFKPDGYNLGINNGEAAGQTVMHLHIYLIPRYFGDVENPRGGVRNIFPEKGDYTTELKKRSIYNRTDK